MTYFLHSSHQYHTNYIYAALQNVVILYYFSCLSALSQTARDNINMIFICIIFPHPVLSHFNPFLPFLADLYIIIATQYLTADYFWLIVYICVYSNCCACFCVRIQLLDYNLRKSRKCRLPAVNSQRFANTLIVRSAAVANS